MPRTFDHDLHAFCLCPGRQLAQGLELLDLGLVRCVGQASGPQPVAKAQNHVMLLCHVEDLVIAGIERVFFVVMEHPLDEKAPSA